MAIELNAVKLTPPVSGKGSADQASAQQTAPATEATEQLQATREQLDAAVSRLSEYAQSVNRGLNFSVEESLGRTVITVTDRDTDEVVRQIPSEEVLDVAADLASLRGQLLRTSA